MYYFDIMSMSQSNNNKTGNEDINTDKKYVAENKNKTPDLNIDTKYGDHNSIINYIVPDINPNGLFNSIVLDFNTSYGKDNFGKTYGVLASDETPDDMKEFNEDIKDMRKLIDDIYNDDKSDIEDMFDLISIINEIALEMIYNKNVSDKSLHEFLKNVRIYAKKQVKQKFRDYKYNGRNFWNHEEASNAYFSCTNYIWKPSVSKVCFAIEHARLHYDPEK